jgi:hypothetical protein
MRGNGAVFKHPRSRFLWIRYSCKGKLYRESSGTDDPKKATKKLKQELAEVMADRHGISDFVPNSQLRVRDLLDALAADYDLRQVKSIRAIRSHMKPLRDALGCVRAQEITPEMVDRYIENRIAEKEVRGKADKGAARATVNRETEFSGRHSGLLSKDESSRKHRRYGGFPRKETSAEAFSRMPSLSLSSRTCRIP